MFYIGLVLAGGFGALLRYLIGRLTINLGWAALPFGTLIANLLGCFLIGYFSSVLVHKWSASQDVQTIVMTGFLGGFTTFSAFSLETINMLEQGASGKAIVYIFLQLTLCLGMCFLGLVLARQT